MPHGSRKGKASKQKKQKKETANHQTPTNSSGFQGNGPGGDHEDNSDRPFTDEEFSPKASMEAQTKPEPEPEPDLEPEPEPEQEPAVSDQDASVVPIEQQTVSELERTEVATAAPLEALEESSAPLEVREKSGEGSSYSEGTEIPVAIARDTPAAGLSPLLERRATWWNCCGLLDVFGGSQR